VGADEFGDELHKAERQAEGARTLVSDSLQRLVVPSVAALYVAKDSIYKTMPECDCYDLDRNAMTYNGMLPVVAHPPCQLWGKMAPVNYARYGGEHNKPGNDGGCFAHALETVNRLGGVLEHPANSIAWKTYKLPSPTGTGWTRWKNGWVCEVWQSAYGHRARKRTWLYCAGTDRPMQPRWDKPESSHRVGWHGPRCRSRIKKTLSKREANATPPEFAAYLVALAASCGHNSDSTAKVR
jgi:hypothetical protein